MAKYEVVCDHWEFLGPHTQKVVATFDDEDSANAKADELNKSDYRVVEHDPCDDCNIRYIVREAKII